jgi:hypothetical protein
MVLADLSSLQKCVQQKGSEITEGKSAIGVEKEHDDPNPHACSTVFLPSKNLDIMTDIELRRRILN